VVVARERVQQADRADLHEVVVGLACVRVAACELADERHVALDKLGVRLLVSALSEAVEEGLL